LKIKIREIFEGGHNTIKRPNVKGTHKCVPLLPLQRILLAFPHPNSLSLKQIIPRDIMQPFVALIMFNDPGPFYKFIGAKQEIDPHNGQP